MQFLVLVYYITLLGACLAFHQLSVLKKRHAESLGSRRIVALLSVYS